MHGCPFLAMPFPAVAVAATAIVARALEPSSLSLPSSSSSPPVAAYTRVRPLQSCFRRCDPSVQPWVYNQNILGLILLVSSILREKSVKKRFKGILSRSWDGERCWWALGFIASLPSSISAHTPSQPSRLPSHPTASFSPIGPGSFLVKAYEQAGTALPAWDFLSGMPTLPARAWKGERERRAGKPSGAPATLRSACCVDVYVVGRKRSGGGGSGLLLACLLVAGCGKGRGLEAV